jgi:hypothetical protein
MNDDDADGGGIGDVGGVCGGGVGGGGVLGFCTMNTRKRQVSHNE